MGEVHRIRPATYGEFVDNVRKTGFYAGQEFMEEWCALATAEEWKDYRKLELDADLVIRLIEDMATYYKEIIDGTCDEELYTNRVHEAHDFFREIVAKAKELGVEVDPNYINTPVTMTEATILSGVARVVDPDKN